MAGESHDAGRVKPGALTALLKQLAAPPQESESSSAWESALRPGLLVGKFELVREIGSGGFGVVWEARDRELGRSVAFKAVRPGAKATLREERLLREAEAVARLSHPNLVTIFDLGRSEHGPYLVLELLRGRTLEEQLRLARLSPREALRIAAEVAKGVAHAHAEGVVHRDLKPANVFLCEGGQVKVLDFGLAHAFGRRRQDGGTPAYMAPEQRQGAPEDERTDVFALGVLLYEMLASVLPFPEKPGREDPFGRRPPRLEVAGLPEIGDLAARMLEVNPLSRPRDAGEVAQSLQALCKELDGLPAGAATPATVRPQRVATVVAALQQPPALALLAGLSILAAAAGTTYHFVLRRTVPPTSGAPSETTGPTIAAPSSSNGSPTSSTVSSPTVFPSTRTLPAAGERWLVPVTANRSRGPTDAPVTIVEYADFQCPYSRKAEPLLQDLSRRYPGKLRVVWRDYPLGVHPAAEDAAELAQEALRQKGASGFWAVHDRLLRTAPRLGRSDLERVASEMGLDLKAVRAALRDGHHQAVIDADVRTAVQLGVGGTPTFFVNGRRVEGAEDLEPAVAEELAEASRRLAAGVPASTLYENLQRGARAAADPPVRVVLPPPGRRPARGGGSDRAVPVNEFCDHSLARCAWIEPSLRRILARYGDEVRLVWWDVSDLQRPEARRMRRAVVAAAGGDPRRFWAMHDAILADLTPGVPDPPNPEKLTLPALREKARQAGADMTTFDYDMASDDGGPPNDAEVAEARGLGLHAGQIVIDGEVLRGGGASWELRNAIDRALRRER